jgi:hypothetical protein
MSIGNEETGSSSSKRCSDEIEVESGLEILQGERTESMGDQRENVWKICESGGEKTGGSTAARGTGEYFPIEKASSDGKKWWGVSTSRECLFEKLVKERGVVRPAGITSTDLDRSIDMVGMVEAGTRERGGIGMEDPFGVTRKRDRKKEAKTKVGVFQMGIESLRGERGEGFEKEEKSKQKRKENQCG